MTKRQDEAAEALEELGFTALEARIYVELLGAGPQSGYRVAQSIGKAAANTYKALESLEARGAVVCQDGDTRVYRAVPYAELASMLSSEFARLASRARTAIGNLGREESDDRVYRLANPAQVYERARAMIARASAFVLIDAFPDALEELRASIEDAAARGIDVVVRLYAPLDLRGARTIQGPQAGKVRARWPGTWITLNEDGAEALVAYVGEDATVGTWTQNAPLAWILYCGVASETALAHLSALAASEPQTPLSDALRSIEDIVRPDPPGRELLYQHISKKKEVSP